MKPKYILWLIVATLASVWLIFDPAATSAPGSIDAQYGNRDKIFERHATINLDRPTARVDSDRRKTRPQGSPASR